MSVPALPVPSFDKQNPSTPYTVYGRTTDEVNRDLIRLWCDEFGLTFQLSYPKDVLFPADADGLYLDLDHQGLTPFERELLVRRLCLTLLPYPVALTSYDLEPETSDALQAHGVLVGRRLDRTLIRKLAEVIAARKHKDEAA